MRPDPLRVLDHALAVGDDALADLLIARLYPPVRVPAAARRAVRRLERALRL